MNLQDYLTCIGVPRDNTRVPTANDPSDGERCFRFSFGAYGWTRVDVFAEHVEDACEVVAEWLDDNAPGHLVSIGEAEMCEAAKDLGLDYDDTDQEIQDRITAKAEEGLTLFGGHTILQHGDYVTSHEWGFSELTP